MDDLLGALRAAVAGLEEFQASNAAAGLELVRLVDLQPEAEKQDSLTQAVELLQRNHRRQLELWAELLRTVSALLEQQDHAGPPQPVAPGSPTADHGEPVGRVELFRSDAGWLVTVRTVSGAVLAVGTLPGVAPDAPFADVETVLHAQLREVWPRPVSLNWQHTEPNTWTATSTERLPSARVRLPHGR